MDVAGNMGSLSILLLLGAIIMTVDASNDTGKVLLIDANILINNIPTLCFVVFCLLLWSLNSSSLFSSRKLV